MSSLRLPLGIDIHVHFRQPGGEYKETVETGYKAAIAGGVGTVCDMPNTNPPIDNLQTLGQKEQLLQSYPFVHQIIAITNANVTNGQLHHLIKQNRLYKVFMANSTGNIGISHENLLNAFHLMEDYHPTIMVHAEDPTMIASRTINSNENEVRPKKAEISAIQQIIAYADQFPGINFHVTHVSTAKGAELLLEKKQISWDVLVKHVKFNNTEVQRKGNFARMNPPLRSESDRSALQGLLSEGKIPIVSSDHAPHTISDKENLIAGAPGVQELYPQLIDFYLRDIISLSTLKKVIYENPKNFLMKLSLSYRKGKIFVHPDEMTVFTSETIKSKVGWSLWEGMKLEGKITNIEFD